MEAPALVSRYPSDRPGWCGRAAFEKLGYFCLNGTHASRGLDACGISKEFQLLARLLKRTPIATLNRWYANASYSLPWNDPRAAIKPKLAIEAPSAFASSTASLAATLLSRPTLLGRLGNVEVYNALRIADGKHASPMLANNAGVFVRGRSNRSQALAVARAFAHRYVGAARAADALLLLEEHSGESVDFACRFGIPLRSFARALDIDELLELLQALARRRARLLVVSCQSHAPCFIN